MIGRPRYVGLLSWVKQGGLQYLAGELVDRGKYISPGDKAPQSAAKLALIDQSMPTDERMIMMMVERIDSKSCLDVKEIWLWLQAQVSSKAFVSPQRIAALLKEHGYQVDAPQLLGGRSRQLAWKSASDRDQHLGSSSGDERNRLIASSLKVPSEVFRNDAAM